MVPAGDHSRGNDEKFLIECFRAFDTNLGKIDINAVADALGYTNPKSATNRWNALKRSNGFKVDATSGRPVGASPSKGSPSKVTKSKRPGKSIPKPTADEGKPGKRLTSDKENQGAGPEEN